MSALAESFASPSARERIAGASVSALEHAVVVAVVGAADLPSGLRAVTAIAQSAAGATRVEWWLDELVASTGSGSGDCETIDLGSAGELVFYGGYIDPELRRAVTAAVPAVRRLRTEDQLTRHLTALARRNEALEDFAALVAHELKTPLHAALRAVDDDRKATIEEALDLVDTLLTAARSGEGESASPAACLDDAISQLPANDMVVTSDLAETVPMPCVSLSVILRNFLANAIAAGAKHVHVASVHAHGSLRIVVDDDGAGLGSDARYAAGSGIGLGLCRRLAARWGAALELTPLTSGGARAVVMFPVAA